MRVVAGELKGRRIIAPDAAPGQPITTRPTTDRVREAIFNALGSLGIVDGATVADLYAGSGGLGIEALSRGAAHCTFVENDRAALSAIHANIAALGLGDRTRVINGNATVMSARVRADIVFADPPYTFDDWPALLAAVDTDLVVAESPRVVDAPPGWEQGRTKRYGRTWVTFLHREGEGAPG